MPQFAHVLLKCLDVDIAVIVHGQAVHDVEDFDPDLVQFFKREPPTEIMTSNELISLISLPRMNEPPSRLSVAA